MLSSLIIFPCPFPTKYLFLYMKQMCSHIWTLHYSLICGQAQPLFFQELSEGCGASWRRTSYPPYPERREGGREKRFPSVSKDCTAANSPPRDRAGPARIGSAEHSSRDRAGSRTLQVRGPRSRAGCSWTRVGWGSSGQGARLGTRARVQGEGARAGCCSTVSPCLALAQAARLVRKAQGKGGTQPQCQHGSGSCHCSETMPQASISLGSCF